jgi:ribosomal protein S12 methylthiotransferase
VKWAQFDRVGVFRYSDEEDAHAYDLGEKVNSQTSYNRARKLMSLQRQISKERNRSLRDQRLQVLVEGPSEESELVMVGRHRGQAPDIDGCVYLSGGEALAGSLVEVKVSQSTDYDLLGDIDESVEPIFGQKRAAIPVSLVAKASDGRRVLRTI